MRTPTGAGHPGSEVPASGPHGHGPRSRHPHSRWGEGPRIILILRKRTQSSQVTEPGPQSALWCHVCLDYHVVRGGPARPGGRGGWAEWPGPPGGYQQVGCWDSRGQMQAEGGELENSQASTREHTLFPSRPLCCPQTRPGGHVHFPGLPGVVWKPEAELEARGGPSGLPDLARSHTASADACGEHTERELAPRHQLGARNCANIRLCTVGQGDAGHCPHGAEVSTSVACPVTPCKGRGGI